MERYANNIEGISSPCTTCVDSSYKVLCLTKRKCFYLQSLPKNVYYRSSLLESLHYSSIVRPFSLQNSVQKYSWLLFNDDKYFYLMSILLNSCPPIKWRIGSQVLPVPEHLFCQRGTEAFIAGVVPVSGPEYD